MKIPIRLRRRKLRPRPSCRLPTSTPTIWQPLSLIPTPYQPSQHLRSEGAGRGRTRGSQDGIGSEVAMRADVIDEPELEFGGRGRHIDPRFGIGNYGPADLGTPGAPQAIRVGLVGPADQLDGLRTWLERCR